MSFVQMSSEPGGSCDQALDISTQLRNYPNGAFLSPSSSCVQFSWGSDPLGVGGAAHDRVGCNWGLKNWLSEGLEGCTWGGGGDRGGMDNHPLFRWFC